MSISNNRIYCFTNIIFLTLMLLITSYDIKKTNLYYFCYLKHRALQKKNLTKTLDKPLAEISKTKKKSEYI